MAHQTSLQQHGGAVCTRMHTGNARRKKGRQFMCTCIRMKRERDEWTYIGKTVVDQANLNAKQEPFSGVNNWLAANCVFSRVTQWVEVKLMHICACVCGVVGMCAGGVPGVFKTMGFQHSEKTLSH